MVDRIQQQHSFGYSAPFVPPVPSKPICLTEALQNIKPASQLAAEVEQGNHEYKFKLSNMTQAQVNHRISQLQWRLNEGGGNEAVYHIGVEDDGHPLGLTEQEMQESLLTLQYMAEKADCEMIVKQLFAGEQGITAEVLMRRRERFLTLDAHQLTVALAGDVDSGKSTLIGVLCSGKADNGRGLARTRVFTHNHEVLSGRTSCISHNLIHFGKSGEILNVDSFPGNPASLNHRLRAMSDMEVAEITHRTVTLMDVAGHAKYLKTTLHGMVGQKPDYICVCVSAVRGLTRMTMEHVSLAVYLNVPLLLFVTKVDLVLSKAQRAHVQRGTWTYATLVAEVPALQKIYGELQEQLQATGGRLVVIGSARELMNYFAPTATATATATASTTAATTAAGPAPGEQHRRTIPIVLLSSVTGEGVALVKSILFQLPTPKKALRILPLALANPPFAVQPTAATTVKAMTDGGDHATMVSVPTRQRLNYVRVLGALTVTDAKADDALLVDAIAEGDADADADDDDGLDWGDDDDGDDADDGDAKKAAPRYEFDSRRYGQDHSDLLAPPAASKKNTATATSAAAAVAGAGAVRHSSYAQFLQTEKGQRHVADAQRGSVLRLQPPAAPASPSTQPSPPAASAAPASPTVEEPPVAAQLTPEAAQWERDYAALLAELAPFVANAAAAAPATAASPIAPPKTILLGKVMQGRLTLGDVLVLGPSPQGVFAPVAVASLRLNNVAVRYAKTGQTATFQLARVDAMPAAYAAATAARAAAVGAGDAPPPPTVTAADGDAATTPPVPPTVASVASVAAGGRRRTDAGGLVLLPLDVRPMATWEFTAELSVLSTATATATGRPRRAAIKVGYEAVVHVGAARQTAKVVDVVRLSSAATAATDAAPLPSRSSAAQLSPIDVTTATSVDDEEKKRLGPPSLAPSLAPPSHVHGSACSIQMWRESSTGSDAGAAGAAGAAARTVAVGHDASAALSTDADGDAGGRGTFIVTDATPRRVLPALVDVAAAAPSTTDAALVDGAAVNDETGAAAPAAAGPVAELFEGDRALVKFRFVFCPEFVSVGEAMILREDRIRALGTVIETAPFLNDPLYAER